MSLPTELRLEVTIEGQGSDLAAFYFQVGRALTIWAITENTLSEYYCMIVCGCMTPAEGATTTFSELRSFDERRNIIAKCLDQVLYPNQFDTFRKESKKKLNRIKTLSETRNKIAHGATIKDLDSGSVDFYPYFVRAHNVRQEGLEKKLGHYPSTVKNPLIWTRNELTKKVDSLLEANSIASDLLSTLDGLYEENSKLLKDTTRMFARQGLPYQDHPKDKN